MKETTYNRLHKGLVEDMDRHDRDLMKSAGLYNEVVRKLNELEEMYNK